MASYNELLALIDAYINQNGVQAITGQVLNGVLRAMVDQLGRGYAIMGAADPTTDPGTPDGPETWFASVPGTYTNFDGIQIVPGELALLSYVPSDGFSKNTIYEGFQTVQATADDNIGYPQVGVSYANGVLSFDFRNIKGEPGENGQDGDPAGFGTVNATVDDQVGTPSVSVSSSGPDTAKNFTFAFRNLKGETGVTSVLATVDNTSGNPQCTVSLQNGQLTLSFTGLKGAQGDTGSSVDYPFTIVNNLTTNDPAQALSAAMGVQLESEVSQLEAKVDEKIDGAEQNAVKQKYINSSGAEANMASGTVIGYIPYSSGDVVWKYGNRNANFNIAFYNSNKEFLWAKPEPVGTETTITETTITNNAPGAAFLRATIATADGVGVIVGGILIRPIYESVEGIAPKVSDLEDAVSDLQDADTALGGRIDGNDTDIADLQAKDTLIEGRLENLEGPYISPDNGVGGVTSSTSIEQGGVVTTSVWDIGRKWFAEVVIKPVDGSQLNAFVDNAQGTGGSSKRIVLRSHNGGVGYNIVQSGGNVIAAINGIIFGKWYHIILLYDGTAIYAYVNGVLTTTQTATLVTEAVAVGGGWFMNAIHSPKLLRVGYVANDTEISAVASAHYNGGNPFGYDSSNDEMLVEFLPGNMLKTSIKNTANNMTVTYDTEKAFDILTENPWAAVIEGEGVPAILPVYKWQKYKDTTTGKVYTARGTDTVNDWVYQATSEDLLALRTQTKTVGGQSIWGTGDIPAGSGSGAGTFVSVADFGATGDGVTDDTTALQNALEYARANNRALYFPNGTFLTRKGFVLTSGMRVTGEPDAIIQNAAATIEGGGKCPYTTTTANAAQGDHSVVVTDASKFRVGDEIVIWKSGSYTETMADITAINGNTITFDTSRFTADGTDGGLKNAVASAGYVLTDFAMFKTIQTKAAVNVVVENITIKPMSDINEPHIYTSSPISQTRQEGAVPQSNFRVYNVTCYDSANDGISLQGTGDSEVIGCRVFNQKHKGIHFGTSHDKIVISKNYCYGCGSAQYENYGDYQGSGAIFFCSNNHRVIITDNIFENCYKGVYGFNYQSNGEQDTDTVIANNLFKNCGLYGLMLRGGYRAVVVGNIFTDFNNSAIPIHTEAEGNFKFTAGVISNNVFGNFGSAFAGPAIQVTGARNLVLAGNNVSGYVNNDASNVRPNCDITVATSEKVAITNNVVDGVIDISDAGNTGIVKDNNIETS